MWLLSNSVRTEEEEIDVFGGAWPSFETSVTMALIGAYRRSLLDVRWSHDDLLRVPTWFEVLM